MSDGSSGGPSSTSRSAPSSTTGRGASARGRGTQRRADPDAALFRAAALRVGLRVAALSAVLVTAGAVLIVAAVWWKSQMHTTVDPRDTVITLALDPGDIAVAALVLAAGVVLLAGTASVLFARRAVAPLEESMRRQRAFVADASHELRTPIAVVSARAQHLAILTRGDERLSPVVAELKEDCRALAGIVDDLLASDSPGADDGASARADLATAAVVRELAPLAAQRRVALGQEVPGAVVRLGEAPLRRALTALVDNAVGHAPDGGHVAVTGRVQGRVLELRVVDDGPGIMGIAPERVFDRFAHGTSPAHPGRSSHGIGLALVRDIAARAQGSVSVESTGPGGTTMLLRLPLAAAGPAGPAPGAEAASVRDREELS